MRVVRRIAAMLAALLMLLAPALWNGFALLQYDTGGYLARWYEGTLEQSRSTVYGLFLNLLTRPDFWPAVLAQAAVTVWLLALVLRVHGLGGRARVLIVTVAALSVLTTLPWLVDVLLTDIFAGLAVLALHLIVMNGESPSPSSPRKRGPIHRVLAIWHRRRIIDSAAAMGPRLRGDDANQSIEPGIKLWERGALFVLIAFAAATHSATLIVLLALLAVGALVALFDRRRVRLARLGYGVAALALGAAMLLAANYAVAGRLAWTPGGLALAFGRMLNDGLVMRYLDEHCPDPRFRLCDHRQELPTDADVFFWGESVFDRLGRFDGLNDEMRTIVLESLRDYPALQFKAALKAFATQLVRVRTGYGVNTEIWHSYGMIENFVPAALPAMKAARQQQGELDAVFAALNRVHVPVAYGSMLALVSVIALGFWRARFVDLGWLAATAALAILANAAVLGILSGPHDRYGARMVWLATFAVMLVPWRAYRRDSCSRRFWDKVSSEPAPG
jgi:hypothetical protein